MDLKPLHERVKRIARKSGKASEQNPQAGSVVPDSPKMQPHAAASRESRERSETRLSYLPISQARSQISQLVTSARQQNQRHALTRNGVPEAVLLGWEDYRSLLATAELASRPDALAALEQGRADEAAGRGISLDEFGRRQLQRARSARVAGGGKPDDDELKRLVQQAIPVLGRLCDALEDLTGSEAEESSDAAAKSE